MVDIGRVSDIRTPTDKLMDNLQKAKQDPGAKGSFEIQRGPNKKSKYTVTWNKDTSKFDVSKQEKGLGNFIKSFFSHGLIRGHLRNRATRIAQELNKLKLKEQQPQVQEQPVDVPRKGPLFDPQPGNEIINQHDNKLDKSGKQQDEAPEVKLEGKKLHDQLDNSKIIIKQDELDKGVNQQEEAPEVRQKREKQANEAKIRQEFGGPDSIKGAGLDADQDKVKVDFNNGFRKVKSQLLNFIEKEKIDGTDQHKNSVTQCLNQPGRDAKIYATFASTAPKFLGGGNDLIDLLKTWDPNNWSVAESSGLLMDLGPKQANIISQNACWQTYL